MWEPNHRNCGGKEKEKLSLNLVNKHEIIKSIRHNKRRKILRVSSVLMPSFISSCLVVVIFDNQSKMDRKIIRWEWGTCIWVFNRHFPHSIFSLIELLQWYRQETSKYSFELFCKAIQILMTKVVSIFWCFNWFFNCPEVNCSHRIFPKPSGEFALQPFVPNAKCVLAKKLKRKNICSKD